MCVAVCEWKYTAIPRVFFQEHMLEGRRVKNCPKNYNIDYFGYAANLEVKFKLNFDEERGSKIEKKVKIPKKIG